MHHPLQACVVRIVTADGKTLGAGFVISMHGYIITCSHVIQGSTSQQRGIAPPQNVTVEFVATRTKQEATLDKWFPYHAEDIAILRIEGKLPGKVRALPLSFATMAMGHRMRTYGFPQLGIFTGSWGQGEISGLGPFNEHSGQEMLQLYSDQITRGFSGAPVWDESRKEIIGMITEIAKTDQLGRLTHNVYAIPVETLYKVYKDLPVKGISPYKGLEPFTEGEASLFFGYEHIVDQLHQQLQRFPPFMTVLGPQASGKTSVIQAGLLPLLRRGHLEEGNERWGILIARLSQQPFEQLEALGLRKSAEGFTESVYEWLTEHQYTHMVLVLDQFEEFLVHCRKDMQDIFVHHLAELLRLEVISIIVVMRDTFYSLLARHEVLVRWVEKSLINIAPPLSKDMLFAMAQRPAEKYGLTFEQGLLETIVQDVLSMLASQDPEEQATQKSILAMYEFCLTRLWKQKSGNELTYTTYKDIDGISGGITNWADSIFEQLEVKQRSQFKRLFIDLIQFGNEYQGNITITRSRPFPSLIQSDGDEEIIYRLIEEGLLTTYTDLRTKEEMVKIAHDVLLREWTRFLQWIDDDRHFFFWRQQLAPIIHSWFKKDVHDSHPSFLEGPELREAELWLEKCPQDLTQNEHFFIQQSREKRFQGEQEKKQEEEHALQRRRMLGRQLAVQSKNVRIQQPKELQRSMLLAIEAMRRAPCSESYRELHESLGLQTHLVMAFWHRAPVIAAAFSPNGCYLASASLNGLLWIQGISAGNQVLHRLQARCAISHLAFSPDETYLAVADERTEVSLWGVKCGRIVIHISQSSRIHALAFHPKQTSLLAIANNNHIVELWQIREKHAHHLRNLSHHSVSRVVFSPDGNILATSGDDGTIHLWDFENGHQLNSIDYKKSIEDLVFSPDGTQIAAIVSSTMVKVWQWEKTQKWKRKEHHLITDFTHAQNVHAVSFSSDGVHLATASGCTATLWGALDGTEIVHIHHEAPILGVTFSSEGIYMSTCSEDCTARIWTVPYGKEFLRVIHEQAVHIVAFSPNGRYLLTGSESGTTKVWEVRRGDQIARIRHVGDARAVAISSSATDMYHIATAGSSGFVQLSHITQNIFHFGTCLPHGKQIRTVRFSPDGCSIASAGDDTTIKIWDVPHGKHKVSFRHQDRVCSITFSYDNHFLASTSRDGMLYFWDLKNECEYLRFPSNTPVSIVMCSPVNHYMVTGNTNGTVEVWTWNDSKITSVARIQHTKSLIVVAFSPDGRQIAIVYSDGTVRIWSWLEGEDQFFLLPHNGSVNTVAFSHDSHYLATASRDGLAYIWDTSIGQRLTSLSSANGILSVCFSPDGHYLATTSNDHAIHVWETANGQQLLSLPHANCVHAIAFSIDGKYLVTASEDGTASIWLWQPEDLILVACQHLTRNFTLEEWQHYLGTEPYRKTHSDISWRGKNEVQDTQ